MKDINNLKSDPCLQGVCSLIKETSGNAYNNAFKIEAEYT